MPLGHLYVFFGKISIYFFCPFLIGLFVFLTLRCMNCLYILEIIPCWSSFANIFSHSICCLLVLFMISLLCKKKKKRAFKFNWTPLFIFAFISFTLGDPKTIAVIYVSVLPLFSSKSFRESLHSFHRHSHPMASAFTFSSA